jgi:mono/diheme cytochrome c family protein
MNRSFWALLALTFPLVAEPQTAESGPDFARQILPILEQRCFECHGPKKAKAGLRLDAKEAALAGGDSGKVIVPGQSARSPLIQRVTSADEDERMPPKGERLTAEQVTLLSLWVDAGAPWPDATGTKLADWREWWSFKPLIKPKVPRVASHPVDAFIRAKLAQNNLAPSPEADRRTLARRLFLDLTGLPPAPEDVAAFMDDPEPQAYERLVDKLLASPRHGEHWARHWLDVANYADTHGNDHDFARPNAWPYRDYVIRSFNEDKPYVRFVQEQVAGDSLFPEDPEATVALGFLAAGPWDHTLMVTVREDTVDHRVAQILDRDNMVSTAMSAFQSLTVHCARCHNHKFDPIPQREYYALQAVFAGVDRAERPVDPDRRLHRQRQDLLAQRRALRQRDAALLATLDTPEVTREVAAWENKFSRREQAWAPFEVLSVISTGGASFSRQADGSWLASGARPDRDTYIVTARWKPGMLRAIRLEVLPDERLPKRGPGRWDNGNFHLTEFRVFVAPATNATEQATPLSFLRGSADHNEAPNISAAQAIDGNNDTHWGVHPRYGERHEAVFELKSPTNLTGGATFSFLLEHQGKTRGHGLGRFRLSASGDADAGDALAPPSAHLAAILRVPVAERSAPQQRDLALAVVEARNDRALQALPAPQMVYAVTHEFPPDGNFKPPAAPRPIHLLARGDIAKPGELMRPGTLGCVPGLPGELESGKSEDESTRRAALARWLTHERNILTWRSIVNRVWHYHFGRGLCDTPNDFGRMGGTPSHPELLDWLAIWFRDDAKGSLKALHKLLVTSATYRQSSVLPPGRANRDGDNRLLSRMNSPRLTAEQVRDAALQFAGRLDLTMGGPPAVQFVHRGAATFNPADGSPAFLDYESFDPDAPENHRRAIYRFLFRTVPDPFMDALDCPDGAALTPVRGVSTTALQALAMLNDAFLIRQCEHLARRLAAQDATPPSQAESAFRLILLREAREKERAELGAYIQRHGLANACHLLLNSNEFLHVD